MEFLLCTLIPEVQCRLVHRNHVIWRTKITKFWRNGNDSKQPYSMSIYKSNISLHPPPPFSTKFKKSLNFDKHVERKQDYGKDWLNSKSVITEVILWYTFSWGCILLCIQSETVICSIHIHEVVFCSVSNQKQLLEKWQMIFLVDNISNWFHLLSHCNKMFV